MTAVDWFAVDCVANGSRLTLDPDEKRAAVRRLSDKFLENHVNVWDQTGKVTCEDLAERMGCNPRTVQRIKDELPHATRKPCPVCTQHMWVRDDSLIEAHPDALHHECPVSNTLYTDLDWEATTALKVIWLAQRLRAGDAPGVWRYVGRLPDGEGRELLLAALAAVDVDEDDPFWWLDETVKEVA